MSWFSSGSDFGVGVLLTAAVSLVLHLLVGWEATVVAGGVGGLWAVRRGWLVGAVGAATAWLILVVYSLSVSPVSVRLLLETVGALGGNIPGEALVVGTIMLGGILGALGGSLGELLRTMVQTRFA